jgi:KDO2-lipid IV(A) lauroyltransferase
VQALVYFLSLPFIWFISVLPFPVLYFFSDLLCFLIYSIVRYRRSVVRENLQQAFPEKPADELRTIEKKFYRHFCDLFLETAKALTISRESLIRRCSFSPGSMKIFDTLHSQGRHCMVMMGHCGNWEYAGLSMSSQSPYLLNVIYRPLRNKYFNAFIFRLRSRFGARPVAMNDIARDLMKKQERLACTVFIADQTPFPEEASWVTFLNRDTPFFKGADKLSRRFNQPVVFARVIKRKRGYYQITIDMLGESPADLPDEEITSRFAKKLEEEISEQPENWLWSHRRWKYRKPETKD